MSIMPSSHFPPAPTTSPPPEQVSISSNPVVTRYVDAYKVARFQDSLGRWIKIGSLIVGGVIILLGIFYGGSSPDTQNGGFFGPDKTVEHIMRGFTVAVGLVLGAIGFLLGVLVSSGGQITKAALDAAVNTSPFLDNDERARMMSL